MGLRVLVKISNPIRKRARVKTVKKTIQKNVRVNAGKIVMIKSFCRVVLCFVIAAVYVTLVNVAFLFGKVIGTLLPLIVLIAFLTYLENKYHG